MGRLWNDIQQKFLPAAKKAIRIKFRRTNGRWIEFDIAPSKKNFTFKGGEDLYQIQGLPDFEDETGQRTYMFFEGVPYPVKSHKQHPELLVMGREAANQQIMLINAEERGFQKAMLLKGKKDKDLMMWILVGVCALNLLISAAVAYVVVMGG